MQEASIDSFFIEWGGIKGTQGTCTIKFLVLPLWSEFSEVNLCLLLLLQRKFHGVVENHNLTTRLKCITFWIINKISVRQWNQVLHLIFNNVNFTMGCVCYWPPICVVFLNHEVVVFQPRIVTTLDLGSFAYCCVAYLCIQPTPSSCHLMSLLGGNPLLTCLPIHRRPPTIGGNDESLISENNS